MRIVVEAERVRCSGFTALRLALKPAAQLQHRLTNNCAAPHPQNSLNPRQKRNQTNPWGKDLVFFHLEFHHSPNPTFPFHALRLWLPNTLHWQDKVQYAEGCWRLSVYWYTKKKLLYNEGRQTSFVNPRWIPGRFGVPMGVQGALWNNSQNSLLLAIWSLLPEMLAYIWN